MPYHSLSIAIHALAHNSIAFFKYNTIPHTFQNVIIIAMSEMFLQCLQEREDERVLYENLHVDAIVSKCLWRLTMNGKAHNFVFCNWLMMSSPDKMIGRIFWRRSLAMSTTKNQGKMF